MSLIDNTVRDRFEALWRRWARIVWHREEMRRVLEMIREDQRLRYARSDFVCNLREWYADHVGVAIHGERHGTAPSALNRIVRDACADFADFQAVCSDPAVFHDAGALEQLWFETVAASETVLAWFSATRLLLDASAPTVTYDDLDRAVGAFEHATLMLQRAITGGGSSSLLATEQFDWWDVFALPWRPREPADMPALDENIPPSTSTREVAIFPWLELREPVTALGVTILPRVDALVAAGADEEPLRARTNYFFDVYRRRITPSVAFFKDDVPETSRAMIARAAHALLFAASTVNAPAGVSYANATLLEFFFQRLGGAPEFVARRVRRRYGSSVGGSHTGMLRAQRPEWAGSGLRPDPEILTALTSLAYGVEHDDVFEALRWYYVGSTDADPIPPDIDRVHIRTAIERLLQRPEDTQSPRTSEQLRRVSQLTERFVTWQCDIIKADSRNHHQQALWVLIDDRNISLHGNPTDRTPYPFEQMGIPLDWIFDRLFVSLVISTLINRNALADSPKWRGFIEAFELWLAGAPRTMNEIWSGRSLNLAVNPPDRDPRPPLERVKEFLDPAFVYVRPTSEK